MLTPPPPVVEAPTALGVDAGTLVPDAGDPATSFRAPTVRRDALPDPDEAATSFRAPTVKRSQPVPEPDEAATSFRAPTVKRTAAVPEPDDAATSFRAPTVKRTAAVPDPDEAATSFRAPTQVRRGEDETSFAGTRGRAAAPTRPTTPYDDDPEDASTTFGEGPAQAPVDTGPLKIGEVFGRYHVIRLLGIGGMGAVYQAWDSELGVAVAIKVIRPEVMEDPQAAAEIEKRFKRELLLARQVTHKNVVRIHDLGDIRGIKYITMPYVEGSDLASVLKKEGRLSVPRMLHVARSVISGLIEAHKAGVVHRDLKPANIMIAADDEAMIMDFGIARSTSSPKANKVVGASTIVRNLKELQQNMEATVLGAVIGTVEYMAPEQAKGIAVDQRADIYAFGLILYDLLIGRGQRSQPGANPVVELQARMKEAPPPVKTILPEVPEHVDAIISRCLEPDPDKRFQTSEELAAALALLDDNGIPIPIPPRFSKRMIAAAATVVIALVGSTYWFTRTPPPPKKHDPVSVVIADFQNGTKDPAFDHTLEQMLRRALEEASFISAYDRTRIRSALGVRPPEQLNENDARELAVKAGVGVVLAGSVTPRGNGFEISVKATQAMTGKEITTASGRASSKDEVVGAATKLATNVRKALGDEMSGSQQLLAMKSLSTTSLDVASHYAAAAEAQSRGKYEDAFQNFSKAVELDPQFGLGYQGLAAMSRNLGRLQEAENFSKEALAHVDAVTERERYAIRGHYYFSTADYAQCAKEYGELTTRYPADAVAHNQRAICFGRLRQMKEAVEEMQEAVKIAPKHALYQANLALFAVYAGDFDMAEQEVTGMEAPTPSANAALALSQLGRGLTREAEATYQKLGPTGPRASFATAGLGDLAVYEGRYADAVKILDQGAAADLKAKNNDAAAMKLTTLAYAQLSRGQKAPAIATAQKVLATTSVKRIWFLAARVLVEAGAIQPARGVAEKLGAELPAEPQAFAKIIEGQIALKEGNPRQAIKVLTEANDVLDTWFGRFDLGRAYLDAHAYPQATSEFDRCIARRGEASSLLDEDPTYGYFPQVYYYLGRAREGMGTPGNIESYREYVKIRDKATEDPLVKEARRKSTK